MKSILTGIFAAVSAAAVGATILPPSDARVWQTVFDPSQPLAWRWETGAASATLTISNLLTGTEVATAAVGRAEGEPYGSYALNPAAGASPFGETLYDVVLRQLDASDAVLDVETARLAYLPGNFAVVKDRHLGILDSPRIAAYDSGWTNVTAHATSAFYTFTPRGGSAATVELAGASGYFAVRKTGQLSLGFDELSAVWTADIASRRGSAIILR